jgi:hypothetical protein
MGRNADYPGMGLSDRGSLLVVFHPDEGVPVVAMGFLGMIGAFTGANANGVCFGNMLVLNAQNDGLNAKGLSIQLQMRMAAHRARSAREMAGILEKQPRVFPVNVMAADAKEAIVLELGVKQSVTHKGKNGVLTTSNWFTTPAMWDEPFRCRREAALLAAAKAGRGKLTVVSVQKALHAARMQGINLQAVVFEPEARKMHVSMNRTPASAGPYREFNLDEMLGKK